MMVGRRLGSSLIAAGSVVARAAQARLPGVAVAASTRRVMIDAIVRRRVPKQNGDTEITGDAGIDAPLISLHPPDLPEKL